MKMSNVFEKLKGRKPHILGHEQLTKSSILIPLIEVENETHILFEVRALSLRRQPGEICFPGGRIDVEDLDEKQCAIRETTEELGIHESEIEHVVPLDFMVTNFGNIIYPFVGRISSLERIQPNAAEVGEIFTVPLSYFRQTKPEVHRVHFHAVPEEGFPYDLIIGGENYQWRTRYVDEHFYQYNGKVIWGLTAKALVHFLDLLENN